MAESDHGEELYGARGVAIALPGTLVVRHARALVESGLFDDQEQLAATLDAYGKSLKSSQFPFLVRRGSARPSGVWRVDGGLARLASLQWCTAPTDLISRVERALCGFWPATAIGC